ncbi:MAG: hypothetical protein O3A87_00670 [Verrucomicrobia bacterium]|jgi:cytochrome bd-type quinol oxidase subunit 1|nr:hypothetical protein [Verrucomicrobiota bacterium]MDA1004982.1 hypothetical protein [Verrucomicrobiota bacterium]
MSLRGFHIVFVTLTIFLSLFLAVWGFGYAPDDAEGMAKVMGVIGVVGLIVMPIYGVYFYRKAKKLIL